MRGERHRKLQNLGVTVPHPSASWGHPPRACSAPEEEQRGPTIRPLEPRQERHERPAGPGQPCPGNPAPAPRRSLMPAQLPAARRGAARHLPSRVRSPAPQRRGEQRDPAPPAPPRPWPGPRGQPRT